MVREKWEGEGRKGGDEKGKGERSREERKG